MCRTEIWYTTRTMIGSLFKYPKTTACLLAVVLYFSLLSSYLPFGSDLALAVGWLGLGGKDAVASPIWGELVRLSMAHLPGSVAFRLGVVSVVCASLSVLLFAYAVERLLSVASAKAEANAVVLELKYDLPARLGVLLSSLAFIFTPPFFFAATRTR